MKRASVLSMLFFSALLLLSACSSHAGHSAQVTPSSPPSSSTASSDRLTFAEFSLSIQVALEPETPKILKENELRIMLSEAEADKWKNAKVSITLSMPSMDHGEVQVAAEYIEPGVFVAKIIPTMIGEWKADITLEADGKSSTVSYLFSAEP
ncbi:FixH family protein [Brevibacillus centrosporus]|uniref:FixH family protein n=1 Tax=Brevibacillus centrosporus TaxID=54910 RepID=UPI002E1F1DCA|nr:FixH family protein [Brevibacillus centrosporus]